MRYNYAFIAKWSADMHWRGWANMWQESVDKDLQGRDCIVICPVISPFTRGKTTSVASKITFSRSCQLLPLQKAPRDEERKVHYSELYWSVELHTCPPSPNTTPCFHKPIQVYKSRRRKVSCSWKKQMLVKTLNEL